MCANGRIVAGELRLKDDDEVSVSTLGMEGADYETLSQEAARYRGACAVHYFFVSAVVFFLSLFWVVHEMIRYKLLCYFNTLGMKC